MLKAVEGVVVFVSFFGFRLPLGCSATKKILETSSGAATDDDFIIGKAEGGRTHMRAWAQIRTAMHEHMWTFGLHCRDWKGASMCAPCLCTVPLVFVLGNYTKRTLTQHAYKTKKDKREGDGRRHSLFLLDKALLSLFRGFFVLFFGSGGVNVLLARTPCLVKLCLGLYRVAMLFVRDPHCEMALIHVAVGFNQVAATFCESP